MRSYIFLALALAIVIASSWAADTTPRRPPIIQPTSPTHGATPVPEAPPVPKPTEPTQPTQSSDAMGRPLLTNPALYGGTAMNKRIYQIEIARRGAVNPKLLAEIAHQFRKVLGTNDCVAAGFFQQKVIPQQGKKFDIVQLKLLTRFRDDADMANIDNRMNQKRDEMAYMVSKLGGAKTMKEINYPRLARVESDPLLQFSGSTLECGAGKLSQCENGQACSSHDDCLSGKCEKGVCTGLGLFSATVTFAPTAVTILSLVVVALMSMRLF